MKRLTIVTLGFLFVLLLISGLLFFYKQKSIGSVAWPRYSDLFDGRDATVSWKQSELEDFSMLVPFSTDWKINGVGLSVADVDILSEKKQTDVRFGGLIDYGTYFGREYSLERMPLKTMDLLQVELAYSCDSKIPTERFSIGKIQGLRFSAGGARGCSVGFVFNKGDYTYYLHRTSDIGTETPEINDVMKKIIQNITD